MYALVKHLADPVIDIESVVINADGSYTFDLVAEAPAFEMDEVGTIGASSMVARLRKAQGLGANKSWVVFEPQTVTTRTPKDGTLANGKAVTYGPENSSRYYIPTGSHRPATAEESQSLNTLWGERQAKAQSIAREHAARRQAQAPVNEPVF